MRIHELLEHHGISRNPFAEEDAQTDPVFKEFCIATTYHPTWDKVFGDPGEPSTAVVFGEKGAGKTAMRLQIANHIQRFNTENPHKRAFTIQYVDFNPFLDRFRDHLPVRHRRKVDRVLSQWKLWDHMDAILSLGVTDLVDEILGLDEERPNGANTISAESFASLDRDDARDLLLLAACYDQSTSGTFKGRWERLRLASKFGTWQAHLDFVGGWLGLIALTAAGVTAFTYGWSLVMWILLGLGVASFLPWFARIAVHFFRARRIVRSIRIGNREAASLRRILMQFRRAELDGQPMPERKRTDDRYELLLKFQRLLAKLGFTGIVVLVDRLDEPHLIHASPDLMKSLLWPMMDNKFLKHEGLGVKLMLPAELRAFVDNADRDFHERARLDKQNLISSFEWTGESLFDLAETRLRACAASGSEVALLNLFDEQTNQQRVVEAFRTLRVPRRLFKFLYQLLANHCNAHTSREPVWRIPSHLFESTLAVFQREQDAFDRGVGAG